MSATNYILQNGFEIDAGEVPPQVLKPGLFLTRAGQIITATQQEIDSDAIKQVAAACDINVQCD